MSQALYVHATSTCLACGTSGHLSLMRSCTRSPAALWDPDFTTATHCYSTAPTEILTSCSKFLTLGYNGGGVHLPGGRWRSLSRGDPRYCAKYYADTTDRLYLRRRKTLTPNRGRRCSLSLLRQNRLGEGHSKIKPLSPRSEVGSGPIPQTVKSLLITETKDTMINIPDDCGYQAVGNMMCSNESLQLGWTSWSQARMHAQNRSNWHHRIKAL